MVPKGFGSVGLVTNGAIASWPLCSASLLSLLCRRGTRRDGDRRTSRGHGDSCLRHHRRCEEVGDVGVDDDVVVVVLVQLLREVVGATRLPTAFKVVRSSVGGVTNGACPTSVSPPPPPKRLKWLASTANLEPRARASLGVGDA